jgi:hypothetical protein
MSWVDVKVAADTGRARMTLEHTAIIEDHWNQFGPGTVGVGWDLAVMGLARHLATGAPADHATSGVDLASAKERSDRTIAFYRGEIPPDMAHPGTGR